MDSQFLIISRGLIFVVPRNVMFMSGEIIAGEKQIFAKLPKIYLLNQYNLLFFVIQNIKKQNYSFQNLTKNSQNPRKLISRKLIFAKINLLKVFFPQSCQKC